MRQAVSVTGPAAHAEAVVHPATAIAGHGGSMAGDATELAHGHAHATMVVGALPKSAARLVADRPARPAGGTGGGMAPTDP